MMKDFVIAPSKNLKYVLWALIIVVIIALAYQVYKASKAAGAALGDKLGTKIIADQTGVSEARQIICKQIADDCQKAIWRWAFTNAIMRVNNDEFAISINRCASTNEAVLISQLFRESKGDSLRAVVESWHFTEAERNQITYRYSLT